MATFTIHEFTDVGYKQGSTIPAFAGEQTDQTAITTSGTSQQSAAFAATTGAVRVTVTGGDVRIKFGEDPTATAASLLLADGESFDYFSGGAGGKVAVIDA
jgi:ferric-dicitrate binding protein FerR (iron transport regulator)